MKPNALVSPWVLSLLLAALVFAPAQAQESVNKALDDCIKKEQLKTTAKGAAIGALAGLLKSQLGDAKKDSNVARNVAVGAVAGGAIGFATAHFNAVGNCYKKNPSWVPESKLERGRDYEQAVNLVKYKPEMGPVTKVAALKLPASVKAGESLPLNVRFLVLTPDGAEADVVIERKLFVQDGDKETAIPFPGHRREQRRVAAGESIDEANLPIPAGLQGQEGQALELRYEFSVAVADKPATSTSAKVSVK